MARFTFRLPDIGEGIAEAEIVAWHVKVGDRVEEDQQLADMMTDKATVEMESPVSGTVVELAGEVGDQIAIGSALVVIETDGDAPRTTPRRSPRRGRGARSRRRRRSVEAEIPASTKRRSRRPRARGRRSAATPPEHRRRSTAARPPGPLAASGRRSEQARPRLPRRPRRARRISASIWRR